jgi:predicted dehydrogenase
MTRPPIVAEEPLLAELKSFLDAVRSHSTPLVPLEDGRRALALALEVVENIREHGDRIRIERLVP